MKLQIIKILILILIGQFINNQVLAQKPKFNRASFDTSSCVGRAITIKLSTTGVRKITYKWYLRATALANTTNIQITDSILLIKKLALTDSGMYHCIATNAAGQTTINVHIAVDPNPGVNLIDASTSDRIRINPVNGTPPYDFSFNGGQYEFTSYITNPVSGTNTIRVRDANGCTFDTTYFYITAPPLDITIPAAFTPNEDGLNDTWDIIGLQKHPEAHVKIYNRWNRLVYEFNGTAAHGWNGWLNGMRMPMDTYWYIITLNHPSSPLKGYFTLIR